MRLPSRLVSFPWAGTLLGASGIAILASAIPLGLWWTDIWGGLRESSTPEAPSTTIRNVALVGGGIVALWIAFWRGWVADRQSRAAERQAETALKQVETGLQQANTAQQSLLNERFGQGAAMLGNSVLSVRLAGIFAFQSLAEDHPSMYHRQVTRSLCAFVRHPTRDAGTGSMLGRQYDPPLWSGHREDLAVALRTLSTLHKARLATGDACGLDLHGADLHGALLQGLELSSGPPPADLLERELENFPPFEIAEHAHVNLTLADLRGANLRGARLRRALLLGVDLEDAALNGTDLTGAQLGPTTPAKGLTQEQLDSACADPRYPPRLDGVVDANTGHQLIWQGKSTKADA